MNASTGTAADDAPSIANLGQRFAELTQETPDKQCEYFLKSFIFALGDKWQDVPKLLRNFKEYSRAEGSSQPELNHIQASNFLQKHGKTRTAMERKRELNDVDFNKDGKISFVEYLMLHFKVMILQLYYTRMELEPEEDLSNDGIGVDGVGLKLVDELFTVPRGINPALVSAIEQYTEQKAARENKIKVFQAKIAKGGVRGKAAEREMSVFMKSTDATEENRIELTLQAARRKADKRRGSVVLRAAKAQAEVDLKQQIEQSRSKLKDRVALFNKHESIPIEPTQSAINVFK